MYPIYTINLGLCARKIDVGIQKIDRYHLNIFGIVIINCSVKDKLKKIRFFYEVFLLANISLKVVLRILFLFLSKANIWFMERKLVLRTYPAKKALSITMRVEIIDKKEFAVVIPNADDKSFVVHRAAPMEPTTLLIYTSYQA